MGGNCSIPDIIPYNRVETEREMPKLKLDNIGEDYRLTLYDKKLAH